MKTVGEFKKMGLIFVKGDHTIESDGSSSKGDIDFNTDLNFNKYDYFDSSPILEFAWRESTGVKPEFKGLIDVVTANKCEYERISPDSAALEFEDDRFDCYVIKWRPSLNQPSVAETDTKQSAIHKAWVALKGDLSNAKQYDENGPYLAVCIKNGVFIKKGDYCLTEYLVENTDNWEDVCLVSEFTDYCEKMAAEEKRMDIIGQNGNDGLHYDNTAQQVEALAVNDKPIFTQAMADAGELPPVGSIVKVCLADAGFHVDGYDEQFELKICLVAASFINKYGSKMVVISNDFGSYGCYVAKSVKPIDTRTDREKAIDEMFEDAKVQGSKGAFERLYDAGYRKC